MSGRAAAAGTTVSFAGAMLAVLAGSMGVPAPEAASVGPLRRAAPASYAQGAPPGFSGGFGEQTCHACHFHAEVNAGRGRVTLAGVPERFAGGAHYPITITLSRPEMQLGGFQLTARFRDDGAQAGTLAPAPGEEQRVRVGLDGQVQYADQRQKGTALAAPETARWSLIWTAPSTAAAVVFHVTANAADADGTVEGDYIHTTVVESAPAALNEVAGVEEVNRTCTASYKNLNPFAGTAASPASVCGVTMLEPTAARSAARVRAAAASRCRGRAELAAISDEPALRRIAVRSTHTVPGPDMSGRFTSSRTRPSRSAGQSGYGYRGTYSNVADRREIPRSNGGNMTAGVERLVCCFERGSISRRELIAGLAALCATPAAAAGTVLRTSAPQPAQVAPIPVSGLEHIALRVSDLARSTAFYRDHLGGRIRSQSSNSTFLDVGSQWVALFARGAVSTGYEVTQPGVDHIAFHSPQHRSLAERMGVLGDHGLDPVSPAGSNRVYFRDPDGIILQLS